MIGERMDPINYDELDPGIRDTVKHLRFLQFRTTDSGDGVSKPKEQFESGEALPFPHVAVAVDADRFFTEADRLFCALGGMWEIEASYSPNDVSFIIVARLESKFTKPG